MADTVYAITINGVRHCVEDHRGYARNRVRNLTEQCESCGAGGSESTYTVDVLNGQVYYRCDSCQWKYWVSLDPAETVVF
jgi:hypothetical protein